jgi:hypothetical protein
MNGAISEICEDALLDTLQGVYPRTSGTITGTISQFYIGTTIDWPDPAPMDPTLCIQGIF